MDALSLSGVNPLGLKLLAEVPWYITKHEWAKRVMPEGIEFDYALPQEWLDRQALEADGKFNCEVYDEIARQCVWVYPGGSYFGYCCNLATGRVWV